MSGLSMWIVGVIVAILAGIGLFVSSNAHGGSMYTAGLLFFAACTAVEFWLIKKYFDQQEGH